MKNPKANQTPLSTMRRGAVNEQKFYSFSAEAGTPAGFHKLAQDDSLSQLRNFSITTLEEAIAVARVAPAALDRVIGPDARRLLQNGTFEKRAAELKPGLVDLYPEYELRRYSFGAQLRPVTLNASNAVYLTREQGALTAFGSGGSGGGGGSTEVNLINADMPPIRNQGQRYTCVAFATCAVVEYEFRRRRDQRHDFSEQFQYWNCKQNDGDPNGQGTIPDVSFLLARRDGICLESTWPYDPAKDPSANDPKAAPAKAAAASYRVTSAVAIQRHQDVSVLKGHLRSDHPVAIAVPVYDSWEENANTRITGNITLPLPGETETAGHAFVLVGFEDNTEFAGGGFFIVRNSWGTTWGEKCPFGAGYGTIPYKYITDLNYAAHFVRL